MNDPIFKSSNARLSPGGGGRREGDVKFRVDRRIIDLTVYCDVSRKPGPTLKRRTELLILGAKIYQL